MEYVTSHTPEFSAGVIGASIAVLLIAGIVLHGLSRSKHGDERPPAEVRSIDDRPAPKFEPSEATFMTQRMKEFHGDAS